jgi:hypothetical protein
MRIWQNATVQRYIKLYNRVKTYNKLPRPYGLDNQLERDMQALDTIESAVNEKMGATSQDQDTYDNLPEGLQQQVKEQMRRQRRG